VRGSTRAVVRYKNVPRVRSRTPRGQVHVQIRHGGGILEAYSQHRCGILSRLKYSLTHVGSELIFKRTFGLFRHPCLKWSEKRGHAARAPRAARVASHLGASTPDSHSHSTFPVRSRT
jgi:hypothetical protein